MFTLIRVPNNMAKSTSPSGDFVKVCGISMPCETCICYLSDTTLTLVDGE